MPKRKEQRRRKQQVKLTFNHAMIYVRDVERALHFYRNLLGFRLLAHFPPAYARLRSPAGQTTIALHLLEPSQAPGGADIRLYFEVKELDRLCKKLVAEGVEISQMPKQMPWGWRHAYLGDPDGHEVSLYWAGKKRLQKPR